MLTDSGLRDFLDTAAAATPAPGGGSVSALCGALGASMASMAANFTLGRKKFEGVREQVEPLLACSERVRLELTDLVDEDARAYEALRAAQRSSDEDASAKAAKDAAAVPLRVVELSLELLCACRELLAVVNPALLSDVGVAAALAQAAMEGGALNVEVNLPATADPDYIASTRKKLLGALHEGRSVRDEVVAYVTERIAR